MLVLVREDGRAKISWWWCTEKDAYFRRAEGNYFPLTKSVFLRETILQFPNSQHCDGVEKWIAAGRPR